MTPARNFLARGGSALRDFVQKSVMSGKLPYQMKGVGDTALGALKLKGNGSALQEIMRGASPAGRMYRNAGAAGGAVGAGALGLDAIDGQLDHPALVAAATGLAAATPVGRRMLSRATLKQRHNSALLNRLSRVGFDTRLNAEVAPDVMKTLEKLKGGDWGGVGRAEGMTAAKFLMQAVRARPDNTLHVGVLRNSGIYPMEFAVRLAGQAAWDPAKRKAMADMLSGSSRKVNSALRKAHQNLGIDQVNAGEVINANAFRTQAEHGLNSPLAQHLGRMGYKRLYGTAPHSATKKLNSETADVLEGYVTTRRGWRSGNPSNAVEYRYLPKGDKQWLAAGGIRNADDFESATEAISMQSIMHDAQIPSNLWKRNRKPTYDWEPQEFVNDAGRFRVPSSALDDIPSIQEIGKTLRGAPRMLEGTVHPAVKGNMRTFFDPASKPSKFDLDLSGFNKQAGALGGGISSWLGDMVPFTPSSMRRAGAAEVMARRMDEDPGYLVKHPLLSQLLAAGAGGALAYSAPKGLRTASALAPLAVVQILKRRRMQEIGQNYKGRKRRTRLRDVDGLDEMLNAAAGSNRLGMIRTLEMMRQRKTNLSPVSEAADALPAAAWLSGGGLGGMALTTPITELIDHIEGNRLLRKKAGLDQSSGPTLPLFLAAALASLGGQVGAQANMRRSNLSTEPLPREDWDAATGTGSPTAAMPGLNNAFFSMPRTDAQIDSALNLAVNDPHNRPAPPLLKPPPKLALLLGLIRSKPQSDEWRTKLRERIAKHGIIAADPAIASGAVLAHEGGHSAIESKPGLLRTLQKHVYPYRNVIAPLAGVGSMAAGLASGNMLGGALAGAGIGLATGAATLAPEYMASWKGLQNLKASGKGKPGDTGHLLSALATYAAGAVLPSAFAGAAGGWLAGRRKKTQEAETDETGEPIEKIAGVDINAAQALLKRLSLYRDMNRITRDMGHNAGVRFGELNQLAHGGKPMSWQGIRGNKHLGEIAGGRAPAGIEAARKLVSDYIAGLGG